MKKVVFAVTLVAIAFSLTYDGWRSKRHRSSAPLTIGIGQVALAAQSVGAPAGTHGVPVTLARRPGWSNVQTDSEWSGTATFRSSDPVEFTWSTDPAYFSGQYGIQDPDNKTGLGLFTDPRGRQIVLIHLPLDYKPTLNPNRVTDPRRPPREAEFNGWVADNPNASFSVDELSYHGGWLGKVDGAGNFISCVVKNGNDFQSRFDLLPSAEDLSGLGCLLEPGGNPDYIQVSVSWEHVTMLPPDQSEPPATLVVMVYAMIPPAAREAK